MAQLTCRDLKLGYEGRVVAEGLTFSICKGDYLCILGENGSGKSTLAKTILQLNKPLAGSITFAEGLKRNKIGYLPQQTPVQRDFPASVQEIILSGCLNRGGLFPFYSRADQQKVHKIMKQLDIAHLADRCYRELSGGQQQRVLLARALTATQELLLLDEPAAGLDEAGTKELYEIIDKINKEAHITIIMISHDHEAALSYASHILHLGKEHSFFGTTEEYKGGAEK
ncbi:MAG: metal ABC transporter ATP-binding protein [Clostridia bacterium]|nr:metal ABC transporter ATP-binding protein [Clostridia bacterium]